MERDGVVCFVAVGSASGVWTHVEAGDAHLGGAARLLISFLVMKEVAGARNFLDFIVVVFLFGSVRSLLYVYDVIVSVRIVMAFYLNSIIIVFLGSMRAFFHVDDVVIVFVGSGGAAALLDQINACLLVAEAGRVPRLL